MRRASTAVVCILVLGGCSPQKPAATSASPPPTYNTELAMPELMGHVVDPAAWTYWRGSGTEETKKGTVDLSPTTNEGWEQLESGAAALIEAGNLLQLPGRPRAPVADWNKFAQALTTSAIAAKAAAEKHDKHAVFVEGGHVYEVCTACHKEYVIDPMIKAQGIPKGHNLPWPADIQKKMDALARAAKTP